jgi:hypothetical protein
MASSFSNSIAASTFVPPNVSHMISIRLDSSNYLFWLSQISPVLACHDLLGFAEGTEPCPPRFVLDEQETPSDPINPEFVIWCRIDQCVLSLINATLSESVLGIVYGLKTAHQAWMALATCFASQSRSRVSHFKRQLQSLKHGSKSCLEYIQGAKTLADKLSAVGKPMEDEDMISYIVSGLNPSFNSFITSYSFATRNSDLTLQEFQDELLNYETLLENQNQFVLPDTGSFAMMANRQSQFLNSKHKNIRGLVYP